jgi:hypothetical protein
MYVGAAIGKSMEEKVHKVLPMCIDEVTSLKINTTVCTLHLILLRGINTRFFQKNLKGRDHLGDLDVDRRIILKHILVQMTEKM